MRLRPDTKLIGTGAVIIQLIVSSTIISLAQTPSVARARLQSRLSELQALKPQASDPLTALSTSVLPGWITIESEYQKEFASLPTNTTVEDVLAVSYQVTLLRLGQKPGAWSTSIRTEVTTIAGVLCTIGRIFKIPKTANYEKQMRDLQPLLIPGAYERLLVDFSVRSRLLTTSVSTLQLEPLPSSDDLFNRQVLQLAAKLRAARLVADKQ
jgi:hypothetical protein